MFKVVDKNTGEVYVVYAIAGMHFMLFDEADDCWFFGEITNYRPFEEEI